MDFVGRGHAGAGHADHVGVDEDVGVDVAGRRGGVLAADDAFDALPGAADEVGVGFAVVLAAEGVDDEVEAVLEPVEAEEGQVQLWVLGLVVEDVHEGDGHDEDDVAEANQEDCVSHAELAGLNLVPVCNTVGKKINLVFNRSEGLKSKKNFTCCFCSLLTKKYLVFFNI